VTHDDGLAILQPLHLQVGVGYGLELSLEMSPLAFAQIVKAARLGQKGRSHFGLGYKVILAGQVASMGRGPLLVQCFVLRKVGRDLRFGDYVSLG
jgi:hypothetical protein